MPRNTDPTDIAVGSGRAGQGSVTSSSLTFTPGSGGSGLSPVVLAEDVISEEPANLAGTNVQENLNVINDLAPLPRPNRLNESSNPLNLPGLTYSPEPVLGRISDGTATGTLAYVINTGTMDISGILYPADRGVLAIKLDGTVVQAINLSNVFTEGDPEATAAPARVVGQNDLTSPGASAAVDGLPVDITLIDRLPQLTDYTRADFPFLPAGDDPVYEAFGEDYGGYQLAKFTATVTLPGSTGNAGVLEIVHYRTEDDYFADKNALSYETFADFQPFANALYRDADTSTAVAISAFAFDANDISTSAESTLRTLSGVTYYGPVDNYDASFTASGVYDDTFIEDAARVRYVPGPLDGSTDTITYTDYSTGAISPGDSAVFNDGTYQVSLDSEELVFISEPELVVRDPFGREDTLVDNSIRLLIHTATTFRTPSDVPPASRLLVENFIDETTRYASGDFSFGVILNPDGTGSTFDPTASLAGNELEVRGIPPEHTIPTGLTGLGGELAYPDRNYSVSHYPNNPGGSAQPNYSGSTGTRVYFRAFGLSSPSKDFQFRVVGLPTAGNTLAQDLAISGRESFSPTGVLIYFVNGTQTIPIAQPIDLGGAMVSMVEESDNSVLYTVHLDNYPLEVGSTGVYSYLLGVSIEDSSTAATGGDFALLKLELIEG